MNKRNRWLIRASMFGISRLKERVSVASKHQRPNAQLYKYSENRMQFLTLCQQ
ncbi:hypothetical protein C5167_014008 [Papaver somniferum]|uniref:Uncharacterized protein n=1 Tax=Papaver somniferum TaxID=3469 RepID=A0A4Y7J1X8_PAPSO|nr:hypothetical protein C5167_014008 [Papaver somniferum]